MNQKRKGFWITLALGTAIAVMIVVLKWNEERSLLHQLCDGAFVSGVLLFGMGGLKFFRNKGVFDGMAYGVTSVYYTMFPAAKAKKPLELQHEDFYDYTQRKREERKPAGDLLIVGGIYLAASVVLLALYLITEG